MQVILKIERDTVNRGTKLFLVSTNGKGYFAHEVGEKTQWAQVFGGEECKAHRLNPSTRYGNQYVRSWKPKPFKSIGDAMSRIAERANTHVQYF
jgi:hypothetical protein